MFFMSYGMRMTCFMSYGLRMTCVMLCHTVYVRHVICYVIRYAYDMCSCHTVCVRDVFVLWYAYDMCFFKSYGMRMNVTRYMTCFLCHTVCIWHVFFCHTVCVRQIMSYGLRMTCVMLCHTVYV